MQNVDFCCNSNDDASSNSDTSLCSPKTFQNLENEMLEVSNDNATSTVTCETISIEQTSLDETKTKVYSSNIAPTLLTDSTRRRQMSTFEKMMALTCQKCGQKYVDT
ncbi:Uncharacterized protein BM_BM18078 [Brugia malayi]|uniref:Uncharacterized protein n=1 Tax=Brugia malayi TaxID=6279 RepID=A0A4E9F144_BRUMA|nr:Uncharacterized protein BM_BM18078 [Brugia malayi]VIO89900.1 Uncharacterized protein BM_BM18078 [Brugia malayi]